MACTKAAGKRAIFPFSQRFYRPTFSFDLLAIDVGTRPCAPPRPQILAGARLQPSTATSERPMASNRGPRAHEQPLASTVNEDDYMPKRDISGELYILPARGR